MRRSLALLGSLSLLSGGCLSVVAPLTPLTPLTDAGGGENCPHLPPRQAVDFGAVVINTVAITLVTLTNCSNLDIGVTPGPVAGAQAALFSSDRPTGETFLIPIGQSLSLQLSYAPLVPSQLDSANLVLETTTGAVVIAMQGQALASCLQISPSQLSFGFVQPQETVTGLVQLTNACGFPLVTSPTIANSGVSGPYGIAGPGTSGYLAPGGSEDVVVSFHPQAAAWYQSELDVTSNDSSIVLPVPLSGFGGGAIVSCGPQSLDFGTVMVGIGGSKLLNCTNTGTDVPEHPEAGLVLGGLTTDNLVYTAQVDPLSTNPASEAQPLAAGESVQLVVSYSPPAPGTSTGTLTIDSNAADLSGMAPQIPLTGQAIAATACQFIVFPSGIDFGQVRVGTSVGSSFTLNNIGDTDCVVSGLGLAPDCPTVFTTQPASPIPPEHLSGLNEHGSPFPSSFNIGVTFAPTSAGTYKCSFGVDLDGGQPGFGISGIGVN